MCTTGAKIIQPGHEFVLFKNRDFTRAHFDDQVTLTDQAFGVHGLETWDGDDPVADRFSGFSIGFNHHLACCDSNVRMLPDSESYDLLVQEVVEHCTTIEEAKAYVRSQVQIGFSPGPICWSLRRMASPRWKSAGERLPSNRIRGILPVPITRYTWGLPLRMTIPRPPLPGINMRTWGCGQSSSLTMCFPCCAHTTLTLNIVFAITACIRRYTVMLSIGGMATSPFMFIRGSPVMALPIPGFLFGWVETRI